MKNKFLAICLTTSSMLSFAQSEVDALRYANTQRPSTARSLGMGSTFGALGADLSSFFSNPAGVGLYKRGGLEFSLGLNNTTNSALYAGNEAENKSTHVTLNNFGIIGSKKPKNSDWVAFNFGMGYAKTNNFYDNISIKGSPSNTTLMDAFASQASGYDPDVITDALPFTAGLAYEVYAINPQDTLGISYVAASSGGKVDQSKNITRTGAQSETSFAFAGNYKDILMIGGTINFVGVRFNEKANYTESFDSNEPLKNLSFNETLESDGSGVGVKLGFLLKPTDWLRFGAAYHSRTVISFRENYSSNMTSNESIGTYHDWSSPTLITNYTLRTPAHYLVNAAFVLGKVGVIAADYEYISYDNMKMRGTGNNNYNYEAENNIIGTIYRGAHRASAGMELRIAKSLAVRGGAIYQQSPYINGVAANSSWLTYTGGLGYRTDYFFCDLAASYASKNETYYLYQTLDNDAVDIQTAKLNFLLSVGFRY